MDHDGTNRPPKQGERRGEEHPASKCLLDVRIVPHRSLSSANFRLLMALFALVSIVTSVPFVLLGAWPVAGFMGLDVAIFYFAFKANFKSARAYEDIVLTPLELLLAKVTPRGARVEWRFHPVWVRLDREEHVEFGLQRLSIRSKGRSVEIASFLGPDAKADFASKLTRALSEAKRGPRFS